MIIKRLDELTKVSDGSGKPVHFLDDHDIHLPCFDVEEQSLEPFPLHVATGDATIIIRLFDQLPTQSNL